MLEKLRFLLRALWNSFGHAPDLGGLETEPRKPKRLAPGLYRLTWEHRERF